MKKVVVDARMLFSSGIGSYLRNVLMRMIRQDGMHFTLLGNRQEISRVFGDASITVIHYTEDVYSPLWHLKAPFIVPEGDIFWSPHYTTPLFPIKPRIRITTIHDIIHLRFPQYYDFIKRNYARVLMENALKRSDVIITVSRFTKEELLEFFRVEEDRIKVIYNGVDTDFFRPSLDISVLEKYGISPGYILYVGNVKPHKNLITLLKAYRGLNIDVPLIIVGRVRGLKKSDHRVRELLDKDEVLKKRVRILGEVPFHHLPSIYSGAIFLVFPSLYEGFGLPPLEALACGTPAIISDIPVHREIYGRTLPMFDPLNPEELAGIMEKLTQDPEKRRGYLEAGRELLKKYTWEKSAAEHARIIGDFSI